MFISLPHFLKELCRKPIYGILPIFNLLLHFFVFRKRGAYEYELCFKKVLYILLYFQGIVIIHKQNGKWVSAQLQVSFYIYKSDLNSV